MIQIRKIRSTDQEPLAHSFAVMNKTLEKFEQYYLDALLQKRVVFVALMSQSQTPTDDNETIQVPVGYVTLMWESPYTQFWRRRIPEIVDLNVVPQYRQQGIGSALIRACEDEARQHGYQKIGISVVQDDPDYAPARRLYPQLGYEPDGYGITRLDNELHLWKSLV